MGGKVRGEGWKREKGEGERSLPPPFLCYLLNHSHSPSCNLSTHSLNRLNPRVIQEGEDGRSEKGGRGG